MLSYSFIEMAFQASVYPMSNLTGVVPTKERIVLLIINKSFVRIKCSLLLKILTENYAGSTENLNAQYMSSLVNFILSYYIIEI